MAICSLDALKKSSKIKDARIKKEKIKLLQQTIQWKGNRKVKDRHDKILGFDFVFGGFNNIDFNFISCYYWFQFSRI